jgi:Transglutaminase-like superfamily
MHRLSEVRTPSDALLVAQVLVIAALVPVLMRFPLKRVEDLLEPRGAVPEPEGARERHVLALVSLVLDLGRPVLRPTCLARGITRYYALRRAGADVALAFGLGHGPGYGVNGHCWLVRDGEPLLETRDPRAFFTEMYRIPGGSGRAVARAC